MKTHIPTDWQELELKDVIELIRNGYSGKQVQESTSFPVTRIETISDGQINFQKTGYVEKIPNSYKLQSGDLLISNINSVKHIGKIAQYQDSRVLYHGMNLLILRLNSSFDKKFIYFYLLTKKRWFEQMAAQAVNQASINQTTLVKCPLIIPREIIEQQKIAEVLSIIDEAIAKTDQLIAKYKSIKQGLMQDLFRYGIDENGQIRSEKTHIFKDSPLGRIPEEWQIVELGKYAFVTKLAGFEYTNHFDYSKGGEIIAIRALNLKCGKLDLSDVHRIPRKTANLLTRSQLHKGDLVISYVGTLGEVAIIPDNDMYHLAPNVAKISLSKERFLPEFVLQTFLSNIMKNQILLLAGSTTQAALSMGRLRTLKLLCPSKSEQLQVSNLLENADSTIENENIHKKKLISLKQGLMNDLLTGKVRVNQLLN